ncbi:MAG: COG3014 family protein [Parashewanella sp.]
MSSKTLDVFVQHYRSIFCCLLLFSLTACSSNSLFVSYPYQIQPHKQALNTSKPQAGLDELTVNISGNDGLLYAQESGRIAQISGDFAKSQQLYHDAINAYLYFDNQATISASDLGANASSLLLNDNAIPYKGASYERIMLHQYQALNYLFQKKYQGALVEVRRANQLQQTEQNKYAQSKRAVRKLANGAVDAEINRLSRTSGSVTSSFLNAYSFYLTGLIHEILGEPNDAFIDYRKAAQIWPQNHFVGKDLVRLAKQLAMPQYDQFKHRWGDVQGPATNQGEVIILYESNFVPQKQSFTVPFPIDGYVQSISLATYQNNPFLPTTASISGLPITLAAESITNIGDLAINALKEDMPLALARQAARVYAKWRLGQHVDRHKNQNEWDLSSVAVQLFNVVTEQADLRSWLTLPAQAQIARQYVAQGSYNIAISGSKQHNIQVKARHKTLVWAINTGYITRFYSILIPN